MHTSCLFFSAAKTRPPFALRALARAPIYSQVTTVVRLQSQPWYSFKFVSLCCGPCLRSQTRRLPNLLGSPSVALLPPARSPAYPPRYFACTCAPVYCASLFLFYVSEPGKAGQVSGRPDSRGVHGGRFRDVGGLRRQGRGRRARHRAAPHDHLHSLLRSVPFASLRGPHFLLDLTRCERRRLCLFFVVGKLVFLFWQAGVGFRVWGSSKPTFASTDSPQPLS